jgi:hypothetical protein
MNQSMTTQELELVKAVEDVVSYLWNDELDDYQASGRPENHIFRAVEILNQWSHRKRRGED